MDKYETVIWDFNGTLFDDAWLCIDVMNEMLNRRGLKTLSPAGMKRFLISRCRTTTSGLVGT